MVAMVDTEAMADFTNKRHATTTIYPIIHDSTSNEKFQMKWLKGIYM